MSLTQSTKEDSQIIVGISCSHDASACVFINGRIEVAVQLERLTRIKHDGRPYLSTRQAVDYCLDAVGISADDVNLFAFNIQNLLPGQVGLGFPLADEEFDLFDPLGPKSVYVSHHLAHAFAAFYCSPFDSATVMVIDGSGGTVIGADDLILDGMELAYYIERPVPVPRPPYHAESVYEFNKHSYRLVSRNVARSFHPMCGSSSLGETYAAVSQYIFGDWQEGGKLMGLAPYGKAALFSPSLLTRDDTGRLQFGVSWKVGLCKANSRQTPIVYSNLAARIQRDLEIALVERARQAINSTGNRQLAYSGGVALNSVANQKILEQSGVEAFYIMPASNDAGICIGAAAAAHYFSSGCTKGALLEHDFLGRSYSPAEISVAINAYCTRLDVASADFVEVAKRLVAGQVVGWFYGGSEFGPRALGHRSILASPFERETWRHLNHAIKYREEFRPYAPLVLAEAAETYFQMGSDPESPYMLRVVKVRDEWRNRLQAVTHEDGTARVQTVDRKRTPDLHTLLTVFAQITGVPVLVNTSMNVRGEPIVETPEQAIIMLLSTKMDALVLGDQLLCPLSITKQRFETMHFTLGPQVHLQASGNSSKLSFFLICQAQGSQAVEISQSLFKLLADADGHQPLHLLLNQHGLVGQARMDAISRFQELVQQRLVLIVSDAAKS
ncbi:MULTISPECIES: carbamoyltransferase family protein [Calothrix]|uniref:Carbamoyltransferase n=2 Tax=Calothrix TaxID=1186 RepID=A0ABR8AAJ4_9CYAN|nr:MULTISPECIES: carbamoyltransferase C-terminal domain-containing protein [Calothrix]MBD2195787.1 hypothetical protein [Calothrix parietina FACHB-288]MBD2224443.1 hypothetical protein [Calothrix anomala FACHB-343]